MNKASRPQQFKYILPNLFTAASIFAGVFSMVEAVNGAFAMAAWLIMLSLILDGLDGRVARMTNTCSKFGVEFDSLADIVSFGVAPAILIYMFAGQDFGRFGIVASALFVMFGAIRLARFNVMTATTEPSVFIGVPIPTAAVFLAVLVLLFGRYPELESFKVLILGLAVFVSLLMVSNIRYPSFKKVDLKKPHFMRWFVMVLIVALLVFVYPIEGFSIVFSLYLFYGPIRAVFTLVKHANRFPKR